MITIISRQNWLLQCQQFRLLLHILS